MSTVTEFKCRKCDGSGHDKSRLLAGGKVERPALDCMYCDGTGLIVREIEDTFDKMGRMSAVSQLYRDGRAVPAAKLQVASAKEANWFSDDWEKLSARLPAHWPLKRTRGQHVYSEGERRVSSPIASKPKPTHKVNHIVTAPGRTAPRIVIKTKIKPPFAAKKNKAARHYRSNFIAEEKGR